MIFFYLCSLFSFFGALFIFKVFLFSQESIQLSLVTTDQQKSLLFFGIIIKQTIANSLSCSTRTELKPFYNYFFLNMLQPEPRYNILCFYRVKFSRGKPGNLQPSQSAASHKSLAPWANTCLYIYLRMQYPWPHG